MQMYHRRPSKRVCDNTFIYPMQYWPLQPGVIFNLQKKNNIYTQYSIYIILVFCSQSSPEQILFAHTPICIPIHYSIKYRNPPRSRLKCGPNLNAFQTVILLFRSETRTLLYKLFLFVEYLVVNEWQTEDESIGLYIDSRDTSSRCVSPRWSVEAEQRPWDSGCIQRSPLVMCNQYLITYCIQIANFYKILSAICIRYHTFILYIILFVVQQTHTSESINTRKKCII